MENKKLTLTEALSCARETRVLEIGTHILPKTPEVFARQFPGATPVIIADTNTFRVAGRKVTEAFERAGLKTLPPFIYEDPAVYAEYKYVEQLEASLKKHNAIPVAVGSGSINDLAKLAAHKVSRPYMCVATAASMDGYTAFGASITYKGSKQTFNCPAPVAVVADLEVIGHAPEAMTASGYADLLAKITAGADWLLADAFGAEPIDQQAWNIVQGGLRDSLSEPQAIRAGAPPAVAGLTEGLMLGGFAMQWAKSSRPASGAEHQFSHLWDMQHHIHDGKAPSHGFKVGIGTLAVSALYEQLLTQPIEQLSVKECCAQWPEWSAIEKQILEIFAGSGFEEKTIEESKAKYVTREDLAKQLEQFKIIWPDLKKKLAQQLIPFDELQSMLKTIGAPYEPEQIGITRERLKKSYIEAFYIRRRFTILDLAFRTSLMEVSLKKIFGPKGRWPL